MYTSKGNVKYARAVNLCDYWVTNQHYFANKIERF